MSIFHAINPANGQKLEPAIHESTSEEVSAAVAAAKNAFEQARGRPARWPAELLERIADRMMNLGDPLLERAQAETALPRPRLIGERARTVGQLKMFASIVREGSWVDATIDTADPKRTPAPRPDIRRMLVPRGPVAVFGASNFPLAFGTVGGDTASALAAGCAVVVKGHPSHPGTSALIAQAIGDAIRELKLPDGLFALLQGTRHDLSSALVQHPDISAVGFTGSLRAGRAIFDLAAARPAPIPVFAEMGSVNPLFILPGAMSERADKIATGLAGSVLLGVGQFCTKPGLIFTIGDDAALTGALAEMLSSAPAGTMLNQNLRESFTKALEQVATRPGVKTLTNGQPSQYASISPSLFETDAVTWQREQKLHEEAFGPAAVIVHCRNIDEALGCIDHLEGNLTGTLHISPSDHSDAAKLIPALSEKVGRVIINGYPTGVEVNNAIVHGGPYPATTDPGFTSVGSSAIARWVRPIAYQDLPDALLPEALRDSNPLGIERIINGVRTRDSVSEAQKGQ
jgi:NADP-dependent aldehyde dehydrogenase